MSSASKPSPSPAHLAPTSPASTGLKPRPRRLTALRPAGLAACSARDRALRTRLFAKVTRLPL